MNRYFQTLVFLIVFISGTSGQKTPIKFGEVNPDDLKMTSYPGDTSAAAVILVDFGELNTTTFEFKRILRIKILKKEGTSLATNVYPSSTKSMIKGITYNLEDGKIVQEKLKNESIFSERVTEDRYLMRVAMPNVKVGSIFDIQFTFLGIPYEWNFQDVIPVRYSELILPDHPYVRFRKNFFGYERLSFSSPIRWVAKDMPSFKQEPYINSKENYLTKLEFDILDITFGSSTFNTSTWEAISNSLMIIPNFGLALKGSTYLNSMVETLKGTKKSGEELLKLAYDEIKKNIKWDEHESLFASGSSLNVVYKSKVGNSADINLILAQVLKKLDFEVTPVVLSTRENGLLSHVYPSLWKLNYVILKVKIGDKYILVDATEPYMPYYLLPLRCLNGHGRLVNETNCDTIDLIASRKNREIFYYDLNLCDDNSLKGKILVNRTDYGASDFRKNYFKFNSYDAYLEDFKKDKPGLIVDSSSIENIDSVYLPVNEAYDVTVNNQVNMIGDELYIIPLLYNQIRENPFKLDERKYPVDFGINFEKTVVASYKIPDNYIVASLPASATLKLPGNSAVILYESSQLNNTVKVVCKFSISKTMFLPSEYLNLKEFYNQLIRKESEPIILKRK